MKISTVSEMRELDRTAIEKFGIPEELLMENAGIASYTVLNREIGVKGKTFAVFCGIGNNGGDGLVIARKIHSDGGTVKVFILGDPDKYRGAAKLNSDIVFRLPVTVRQIASAESLKADIADCDAVVDAIFGTGLTRCRRTLPRYRRTYRPERKAGSER